MGIKFNSRFLIKSTIICLFLALIFDQTKAQTDSIERQKKADSQDLFQSKYEEYKAGKNISGLVAVADHNHYPLPEKVLTWQKQLQLSDRQKAAIGQINTGLQRKVKEMNGFLITNEKAIDSLFKYKKVNNGMLIFYTNRYGLYQGELRNALLQACIKTEAELTVTQIRKYDALLQD